MKNIYTNTNATFTAANGQTISYSEIFDTIRKSVEFYGRKGGRDLSTEELEDLFEDCILKALKYCKSYDPSKATANAWARQIVANAQRDAFRRHCRDVSMFVKPIVRGKKDDDEPTESFFDTVEGGFSTDGEMETSEAMERIINAINSLSENYRFIISLHLEGMKPKKMAELIGCTADAASILLCRARKALRKALGRRFLAQYGLAA